MTRLMHGFPPSANGQVTLANWRQAPFSRWAFHHLVDTSTDGIVVARGGRIVFERYANDMAETRPHILMSVGDRGRYPGRRGVLERFEGCGNQ